MLKEQDAGMPTADVCRRHGISSATFYKWKSKYGGLEVSDARRLRQLEHENERLKKLLADLMLDNAMLKEISAKNSSAQCQAASGGSSPRGVRGEPAPRLRGAGPGSDNGAIRQSSARRCEGARAYQGTGQPATAVRLPTAALAALPGRMGNEPQEVPAAVS